MIASHKMRLTAMGRRRGAAMVIALVTLLVITLLTATIVRSLLMHLRQTRVTAIQLQAAWIADAALGRAVAQVRANRQYDGVTWRVQTGNDNDAEHTGVADIRVARIGDGLRIKIEARYPDDPTRRVRATRSLEVADIKPNLSA